MVPTLQEISIVDIELGDNVRQKVDDARVRGIAATLVEQGLQVPVDLEPGVAKPFSLVDGLHRYRAHELLGLKKIAATIRPKRLTDAERGERQLVINTQRSDLNPIEKARAIDRLVRLTGATHADVAKRIGQTPGTITKLVALLSHDEETQEKIARGVIGQEDGYRLARVADPDERRRLTAKAADPANHGVIAAELSRAPRPALEAPAQRKVSRATVHMSGGRKLTLSGESLSIESLVECLETIVSRARKASRHGVDLAKFLALVNAETAAGGAR